MPKAIQKQPTIDAIINPVLRRFKSHWQRTYPAADIDEDAIQLGAKHFLIYGIGKGVIKLCQPVKKVQNLKSTSRKPTPKRKVKKASAVRKLKAKA